MPWVFDSASYSKGFPFLPLNSVVLSPLRFSKIVCVHQHWADQLFIDIHEVVELQDLFSEQCIDFMITPFVQRLWSELSANTHRQRQQDCFGHDYFYVTIRMGKRVDRGEVLGYLIATHVPRVPRHLFMSSAVEEVLREVGLTNSTTSHHIM